MTYDLVADISREIEDPLERELANQLLYRVDDLSRKAANNPDLDAFYARMAPITHDVEALINRHRGGC